MALAGTGLGLGVSKRASVETVAIGFICAIGACLQGSIGFGAALIAAPLLLLIDPRFVPGPLLLCVSPLALAMLVRDRGRLRAQLVLWALLGCAMGSMSAALLLDQLSLRSFGLVFAGLVLFAVAISAWGRSPRLDRRNSIVAGALAGLMGTFSSIGGPPIALLWQDQPGAEIRANLAAYFAFSTLISLAALFSVGRLGSAELEASIWLLPGFVFGFALSHWTAQWADRGSTRPLILAVSTLSALIVVFQNISSES